MTNQNLAPDVSPARIAQTLTELWSPRVVAELNSR